MLILETDKTEHKMSDPPTTPTLRSTESESTQTEPFPDLPLDDELAEYYSSEQASPETIKPNPGPAQPTHYLCRGGGRFTPMIAVDELPSHLKVLGVPLSMSFKEIVDVGGTPCMPAIERAAENYLVVLGSGEENHRAVERFVPGYPETVNVPSSDTINVCS